MSTIDWLVLSAYFAVVLGIGFVVGRGEKNTDDYFLGGRSQPWWVVGLSILATELSALTFIGVPGKAFRGDWTYLQFYFGSFVGRMIIVWLLLPAFYQRRITTVYEYLGERFGTRTRVTAALLFFASRIIGSGLRLLAASLAISVVFDWPLTWVIVGAAAVAIAYTTFGGIKAVIWTDAFQALIFLGCAAAAVVFLIYMTPGTAWENLRTAADAGKLRTFNWSLNLNDPSGFALIFIHTLFLNTAVFGTDQDMMHRMLTCKDLRDGQRSLTFNAMIGLPVVILFLCVGAGMYVYYAAFPAGAPPMDVTPERTFPYLIANSIPAGWGLKGLLVAGVFAAAMSSLDSALGALSATAVVDFYKPFIAAERDDAHYLRVSRCFVFGFGILLTLIAIGFATHSDLLYEAFKWASLIFGSLLGVFLLGVLTKRRGSDAANPVVMLTAVAGLAVLKALDDNALRNEAQPVIAWLWWIVLGTGWTLGWGCLFTSPDRISDPSVASVE